MNQSQRNYLIEEVKKTAKAQVDALYSAIPEAPSLSHYLLHAVMSGTAKIKSNKEIMEMIKQKALTAKEGTSNWLAQTGPGSYSAFGDQKSTVVFKSKDFFEIPEDFKKVYREYKAKKEELEARITEIYLKEKGLVTRITLASDKTLQKMINEVDDMGDLSLVDGSLKLISTQEIKRLT